MASAVEKVLTRVMANLRPEIDSSRMSVDMSDIGLRLYSKVPYGLNEAQLSEAKLKIASVSVDVLLTLDASCKATVCAMHDLEDCICSKKRYRSILSKMSDVSDVRTIVLRNSHDIDQLHKTMIAMYERHVRSILPTLIDSASDPVEPTPSEDLGE